MNKETTDPMQKSSFKRHKMKEMDYGHLVDKQLYLTLNKAPRQRTAEEISLLEQNMHTKPFLSKFGEEHGATSLRELLTMSSYE